MLTALIDEKGAGIKVDIEARCCCWRQLRNFFGALRSCLPRRKVFAPAEF